MPYPRLALLSHPSRASRTLRRTAAASAVSLLSAAAWAAPSGWSSSQISVQYDPDTFVAGFTTGSSGGYSQVDVFPTVTQLGETGLQIDLSGFQLYASSYSSFSSEYVSGWFTLPLSISAQPGYIIHGYTVALSGSYYIESPGSVEVFGPDSIGLWANSGIQPFNSSTYLSGATLPTLEATLGAIGDIGYVEVFEGYEQQFSHYEQVLDHCEPDNPGVCHYRDEAVYIDVPTYRYEMDLGEATLSLDRLTVYANVTAVPEPGVVGLVAASLPMLGWAALRRRRARGD